MHFSDFGTDFGDLWVLDLYQEATAEDGWSWDSYRDTVVLDGIETDS